MTKNSKTDFNSDIIELAPATRGHIGNDLRVMIGLPSTHGPTGLIEIIDIINRKCQRFTFTWRGLVDKVIKELNKVDLEHDG